MVPYIIVTTKKGQHIHHEYRMPAHPTPSGWPFAARWKTRTSCSLSQKHRISGPRCLHCRSWWFYTICGNTRKSLWDRRMGPYVQDKTISQIQAKSRIVECLYYQPKGVEIVQLYKEPVVPHTLSGKDNCTRGQRMRKKICLKNEPITKTYAFCRTIFNQSSNLPCSHPSER